MANGGGPLVVTTDISKLNKEYSNPHVIQIPTGGVDWTAKLKVGPTPKSYRYLLGASTGPLNSRYVQPPRHTDTHWGASTGPLNSR